MQNNDDFSRLPYNPHHLPRELCANYISASDDEQNQMLEFIDLKTRDDLFRHLPEDIKFSPDFNGFESLSYSALIENVEALAKKNHLPRWSFLGGGIPHYQMMPIVSYVSSLRGLATAYTPYQAERSQGTLTSFWIFQNLMAQITGFEAINASMYDRPTALFEAMNTATRLAGKGRHICVMLGTIYPNDQNVIQTMAKHTDLDVRVVQMEMGQGVVRAQDVLEKIKPYQDNIAAIAYAYTNCYGNLEDVDGLTDLAHRVGAKAIAVIDPMQLASGGLKPPSLFGNDGADIIVGEAQHLAIEPNFGGPGLGILGIRYNQTHKQDIRSIPGRLVGKAVDVLGNVCTTLVLSTREQHIRREKATSNICSNQAFIATLVGAALLERGEAGLTDSCLKARQMALLAAEKLLCIPGVQLAFPHQPFFNEFTLAVDMDCQDLIQKARAADLHIGINVSQWENNTRQLLMLNFTDLHSAEAVEMLVTIIARIFSEKNAGKTGTSPGNQELPQIPLPMIRREAVGIPTQSLATLKNYYQELEQQNISPDYSIYPLGSCTMKYNPYINEYAANLPHFTQTHPAAPLEDCQGNLEVLYKIQEYFKLITGLAAVTTQPVAGAQGELVGLKMFQAFHQANGELDRDIILIPRSAHGTNPATATMAGFTTKKDKIKGLTGIVLIEADSEGLISLDQLEQVVAQYGKRISGIMVTNPNTSGLFETRFKEMANLVHSVGALVFMDGANMNAIAGWVDLQKLGVDAVHNNLHKTWSIPHGGGGPGDGIVAVSEKLKPFLPGVQIEKEGAKYTLKQAPQTIGSFHRHFGNFAHKVRTYTYLNRLGAPGIKKMSAMSVLASRYLYQKLQHCYRTLPKGADDLPRMHEFILALSPELVAKIELVGIPKAQIIGRVGKLFLDFGFHAPTVSFPDPNGLMIEPTESYSKAELDKFVLAVESIHALIQETPAVLLTVPHFTPVARIDEVGANREVILSEAFTSLPPVLPNRVHQAALRQMSVPAIIKLILKTHTQLTEKMNLS